MSPLRRALLTLSLAAAGLSGVACQGAMTEDDALVGEASSYLTVADETGDVAAEAAGAESDATVQDLATDSAELPSSPESLGGVCDVEGRRQQVLAKYDENGDGTLGPVERRQLERDLTARVGHPVAVRFAIRHRAHVLARVKWAFDENGDGVLSTDERTAMVDAMEARCLRIRAHLLEKFDANHDGALDASEKQAAKDALKARVQALRQQVLATYDLNTNGVLDDGERAALRDARIAAFKAKRAEVKSQFDANHDGTLDDTELLALKRAIQQRIAEGRDAE
jgi:hypothetical protein